MLLATVLLLLLVAQSSAQDHSAQNIEVEGGQFSLVDDSDDEVRLVIAMLIGVAVIALLGTFIYWVRSGEETSRHQQVNPDEHEPPSNPSS